MSSTIVTAIGFAAALLTTIAFLPQAVKIWRSRSSRDVSLSMAVILLIGVVLWLTYGLLRADPPIIAANVVTLFLAGSILVGKLRFG
ncbi:MAG: SemiSWEET transporter [Rhodospirillaceae bacterium]|jgi:MtN3 and saliva related transmembrane protein|nr:SemiSWEET transporter [Rhodospirillaceae bacterium]MBT3886795.1 SemiSWEET transporter [Rhodospirillaceae bacterium]MBT4117910.1 SemiSWEET transporter [Rhodospirillaceae bacterium]MBT4671943.1 SemiSWEET transporter [Rhodospirillaceae bacterium]MBT4748045.1 SemiSWEET transporter [Rhodospirillaceae bacterium]